MKAKNFFSEEQQQSIINAISSAELNTSGEIRLHLVDSCKDDPKSAAVLTFEKSGMTQTKLRNGVLIYMAVIDKKFAIIGDKGINDVVPADFWDSIKDDMTLEFKNSNFEKGLISGIEKIGEKLKTHFPFSENDKNELNNDISF